MLLDLVPDIPGYVEARSAVIGGRAKVFGESARGMAVLDAPARLVLSVGDSQGAPGGIVRRVDQSTTKPGRW